MLMKCSLKPISLRVIFTNRSNSSPLPSFQVPLLLQRERALRKFVPPSIGICSQLGHSEFKLVVIIDDSDSVSLEQVLLMTDLLKLYLFPLKMEGGLWLQARDALAGIAEISRQRGGESIDMYCLNNTKSSLDLRVGHASYLS